MNVLSKGTNFLGKVYMTRNLMIGLFITCILCLIGGLLSRQKYTKFISVKAKIIDIIDKTVDYKKLKNSKSLSKSKTTSTSYTYTLKIRYTPGTETFTENQKPDSESVNANTTTTSESTPIEKSGDTPIETNNDENDFIEKEFMYTTISTLNVNDEILLEYDPDNPENVRKPMMNPNIVGYIFVGVGFCVCIGTVISTMILSKSKTARQVYGVTGTFRMFL
jgi:hypothetical protein